MTHFGIPKPGKADASLRAVDLADMKSELAADYAPNPTMYDEMVDRNGQLRPHWRPYLDALGRFDPSAIERILNTAQRMIRDHGVGYSGYEPKLTATHPWRLDPAPLLIAPDEWQALEFGLCQRARLLNAVVQDIYGEQTLLRQGQLPAALVHGNENFLRPLHQVSPENGTHIHMLAFDLARGTDDRWWVMSDRVQSPAGAGYALENRVAVSRALPEVFREVGAHRIGGFFQGMSDGLASLARREEPLITLLTEGPHGPAYLEHAYLARYLGFQLVEGEDLTVRDAKVYLKTLDGLKQVDLILRRAPGDLCDPLELRTDSAAGVAGLVSAVRAGNVIVANSLGSGVVESEALMAFYPKLCEQVLGEALSLPSIATWWCGQDQEREYVIENLDRLHVRSTFKTTSILHGQPDSLLPTRLDAAKREALIQDIRLNGHNFFGRETPAFSTAPVWRDGKLQPLPIAIRLFVCFDGEGYRLMPGGLARVAETGNAPSLMETRGALSKDIWALSESEPSTFTRLPDAGQPVALRRSGANLASRAADNLFWLGRYIERAESSMRLLRSMIQRLAGEAGGRDDTKILARLTRALIDLGHLPESAERLASAGELRTLERELARMLAEPTGPSGLLTLLSDLDYIASLVRERLSVDSWRFINNLRARAAYEGAVIRLDLDDAVAVLNDMLADLAAFSGMQMENMTRSLSWRMLDAGRRLERASHMTALLRAMAIDGDPANDGRLDLLLELGDSAMTYRSRYFTRPRLAQVIDLLLFDDTNPRSVAFQTRKLAEHAQALPGAGGHAVLPTEEYLIESLNSRLKLGNAHSLIGPRTDDGERSELKAFLDAIEDETLQYSNALARKYFSHVLPTRSAFAGARRP